MVGLNKALNILILILACFAVGFGVTLFKKREELKRHAEDMAKIVNEVVGVHEGQDLKAVMASFKEKTNNVIDQREKLGATLSEVLVRLDVPAGEKFDAAAFKSLDTYLEKDKELLEIIDKVNERDNAIVDQVASAAELAGGSIDPQALKSLDDYTTPLDSFTSIVQGLKDRADAYAATISELCGVFDVSAPSLDGDDYLTALDTVKSEIQVQKDELEQTKVDLQASKEKLAEKEEALEAEIAKLETAKTEIESLKEKLANFIDVDTPETEETDYDFQKNLEGKILRVNQKWGFVVIDLGTENKMLVGKNKTEKTVPLKEDVDMDVARGSKFVGQIHIVKVAENCAIGDIVPDTLSGQMEPGDKVFFARNSKVDGQEKVEGEESAEGEDDGSYNL